MMMKFCKVLVLLVFVFPLLVGCSGLGGSPTGLLVTSTTLALSATAEPVGVKTGEACAVSVLGLVAIGDASIPKASRLAGITVVSSVDTSNLSVLGLFLRTCTIVTGR